MPDVVGIRFKRASPVYYFDPVGLALEVNDYVIVDTAKGLALGRVVLAPKQVLANEITEPLKPVVRKATPEDFQRVEEFKGQEKGALARCEELVKQFNLPMKLLRAEYNADGTRLTVFFSSEQRVDFRELLKKLTNALRTRVELRQVGARDEAKLMGGLGRCGRPLCCANHLCSFESVSVKLAKEQNLPLNPSKISGLCGKLLCCLGYESNFYRAMKEQMPKVGQRVSTPSGEGKAIETKPLRETVVVELDNETTVELPLAKVTRKAESAQSQQQQQRQDEPQGEKQQGREQQGKPKSSNGEERGRQRLQGPASGQQVNRNEGKQRDRRGGADGGQNGRRQQEQRSSQTRNEGKEQDAVGEQPVQQQTPPPQSPPPGTTGAENAISEEGQRGPNERPSTL